MRSGFAGVLLFALLPGCMQDRPSPTAFQALDTSAAPPQGEMPAGCDSNFASAPGQSKEYDLFKNLASAAHGCTPLSPVTYQKIDAQHAAGRAGPSASPQQEELDRAACRSEGENAAKAARGLQPGEYDLFKNTAAVQSGDIERAEESCMSQRGYKSVAK